MNYKDPQNSDGSGLAAAPGTESGAKLEIKINDKVWFSAYVRDQPKNDGDMIVFLKELVAMIESPEVPDPELNIPNDQAHLTAKKDQNI